MEVLQHARKEGDCRARPAMALATVNESLVALVLVCVVAQKHLHHGMETLDFVWTGGHFQVGPALEVGQNHLLLAENPPTH